MNIFNKINDRLEPMNAKLAGFFQILTNHLYNLRFFNDHLINLFNSKQKHVTNYEQNTNEIAER
jgi:hypothetical protein